MCKVKAERLYSRDSLLIPETEASLSWFHGHIPTTEIPSPVQQLFVRSIGESDRQFSCRCDDGLGTLEAASWDLVAFDRTPRLKRTGGARDAGLCDA